MSLNQSLGRRLRKSKTVSKDLKHLSLFTGCGGMDIGVEGGFSVYKEAISNAVLEDFAEEIYKDGTLKLKSTRFETVFANDIRESAKAVYDNYFKRDRNVFKVESIVNLVKRHWDGEKDVFPKNVDLLTGGFPCQDFSVAGKRMGFNSSKDHFGKVSDEPTVENRGQLYIWMREVIDIVQPKVFIAENVKGLISLGDAKEIIQRDFENIGDEGYIVLPGRVLHAADYGVPQSRERVFFIGFNKKFLKKSALKALQESEISEKYNPFPPETHSKKNVNQLEKYVTLKAAFKRLGEPENSKDQSHINFSKCKFYGKHCQGNREINLNGIGPTIRSEHHGNIEFRRLSPENGGIYTHEFEKGKEQRRLTPRECARVQTFPDDYEFVLQNDNARVSASEAYKLIGNAVPPLLAYHLTSRIQKIWDDLFKK